MKLQGIVIEKEDVAKIGNQFCNIPFVLLTIAVLIPWMLSPPIARVLWIGVRP